MVDVGAFTRLVFQAALAMLTAESYITLKSFLVEEVLAGLADKFVAANHVTT